MTDLQYLLSKLSQRKNLASLSRELLQDILRYLHRIGLVVWYEEIKHLESTVFLQPTFLITMFKVKVGIRTISVEPKFCSFAGLLSLPPRLSFSSHAAPGAAPARPAAGEHLCGDADRGTRHHQRQGQLGVDLQVQGNAVPPGCACLGEAPALFGRHVGCLRGNHGTQASQREREALQPPGALWALPGGEAHWGTQPTGQGVCAWEAMGDNTEPRQVLLLVPNLSKPDRRSVWGLGRRSPWGHPHPCLLLTRNTWGLLPEVSTGFWPSVRLWDWVCWVQCQDDSQQALSSWGCVCWGLRLGVKIPGWLLSCATHAQGPGWVPCNVHCLDVSKGHTLLVPLSSQGVFG